jgi:UDP-N-acetylglucosamine 4-epimerase
MSERLILITGGAGFIGSHACDSFLADGWTVRCFDNFATGNRENVSHLQHDGRFELVEGDIRDEAAVRAAMQGITAVVHLAALGSVPRSIADPLTTHQVNLEGFLQVIEQARHAGVRRFVYASSSSVYGDSPDLPKREERIGAPLSPYAITKHGNELYARIYHGTHGLETIGLRFFNVFGERQDPEGPYAAAIPRFIKALQAHRSPVVFGDGRQSRDFTYVGNVTAALVAAIRCDDRRAFGEVFNVAFGSRTFLVDLLDAIRDTLAVHDPAILGIAAEHAPERQGDIRDSHADVSKARAILGYAPVVDLREGLRRAVPWYVAHWATAGS